MRPCRRDGRLSGLGLGLLLALWASAQARAGDAVEYNRDVRPILSESCFLCHGNDKANRKADLRLDERASAVAKGAVVPGKPDESELLARLLSDDPDEVMPPPSTRKMITPAQKEILRRWIEQGAEYQAHWAYIAPQRPTVPHVEHVANPLDAFVRSAIAAKGLTPAPEADRRTLLRRLSLDLIGLPPTTEEVDAFLNDNDPRAYEKQVDRLLASPHYGERMAVPWLDLVRFADTVGYHGDQNQNVFPYRDYVINAFNKNTPFNVFTTEQLAGDLLPDATPDQIVASGFNRLNMVTREGGAQPKEYLAKYAADRVRTVATTWLGSTMGCCECHDHKFDPFTAADFYRLSAFFADLTEWGVYSDYGYTPNPDLKGFTNDHPFPPEIEVESPPLLRRLERLRAQVAEVASASGAKLDADPTRRAGFETWRAGMIAFLKDHPDGWAFPGTVGATDGVVALQGATKNGLVQTIPVTPAPGWVSALRVDLLPDQDGSAGPGPGATIQVQAAVRTKAARVETPRPLPFWFADADAKRERYVNGSAVLGVLGGWRTSNGRKGEVQTSVWLLERPFQIAEGDELLVTVRTDRPVRVRVGVSPFGFEDARRARIEPADAETLRGAPATPAYILYLASSGWDEAALNRLRGLRREAMEYRDGKAFSVVSRSKAPRITRVLRRGNWQDEGGPVVMPGVPHFLPQPAPEGNGRRLDRLDLARWLTAPENPLTARVFVNRLWKQFFGSGLSAAVDDLGAQGEWPSHPALLDWLAVEFRERGWDVKHMVKLMVMSSTYRQDARPSPGAREADPGNRLVSSQSPRRLEAEFVRDNALSVAGLLNLEMGGPSAHPYQPAGYYANLQFPDRDYVPDLDARQYRRGIYTHRQRTFLHPMLANFDATSREECVAARNLANTPQQALTLLNDPTFVEAARVLAASILCRPGPSDEARIDSIYQRTLARPAKAAEVRSLLAFLNSQRDAYRGQPDEARKLANVGLAPSPSNIEPTELAAWANVCRVVLNLHETITRY